MYEFITGECLSVMAGMPENRFDLVFGSPPYLFARTYSMPKAEQWWRDFETYVDHMLRITTEAARISQGPVVWVIGCPTRQRNYHPVAEAMMADWFRRGGTCQLYRPCFFHRVGIPGSGGKDWFRADTEYIMCFKRPGSLPWSENTAMGHPPKYPPGGEMSYRTPDGARKNDRDNPESRARRRQVITRPRDGMHAGHDKAVYNSPAKANPGNLIRLHGGGGHLGNRLCHENEAPFPERLAEWFIRSLCPPGGTVLDPFSGSGTTVAVAHRLGRNGVGIDIRESQTELAHRRLASEKAA